MSKVEVIIQMGYDVTNVVPFWTCKIRKIIMEPFALVLNPIQPGCFFVPEPVGGGGVQLLPPPLSELQEH